MYAILSLLDAESSADDEFFEILTVNTFVITTRLASIY